MTRFTRFVVAVIVLYSTIDTALFAQQDSLQETRVGEEVLEQVDPVDDSPFLDFLSLDTIMEQTHASLRTRVRSALQQSDGFSRSVYRGSRWYSYQRLKWNSGAHLSGGVLMEKDAGERQIGDFLSQHFALKDVGPCSMWIIGDYFIEAGSGVALWRAYDLAKGANVLAPVRRTSKGLRPYLSSDENAFLRGTAAELNFDPLQLTLFYSHRHYAATMDSFSHVHGLYTEGYFRTESEIAKESNISESLIGSRGLVSIASHLSLGATIYYSRYSYPLELDGGRQFAGRDLGLASFDYHFSMANWEALGEWAVVKNVWGGNTSVALHPMAHLDFIVSYRAYPAQFYSPHGLPFADRPGSSNECGWYLGVQFSPGRATHVSIYYDQFRFPEPTASLRFPSGGQDAFIELNTKASRHLNLSFRMQRKQFEVSEDIANSIGVYHSAGGNQRKTSYRLTIDYAMNSHLTLRERIEHVDLRGSPEHSMEKGFLSYHDIDYDGGRFRWSLRLLFFRTDSYDTRIYEYERDLDGAVSFPALYGNGLRWYFLVRYSMFPCLTVGAKYSDLIRDDVRHIGTGLDELPANHDNRISVQLDLH